jgi:hypothetical protein
MLPLWYLRVYVSVLTYSYHHAQLSQDNSLSKMFLQLIIVVRRKKKSSSKRYQNFPNVLHQNISRLMCPCKIKFFVFVCLIKWS